MKANLGEILGAIGVRIATIVALMQPFLRRLSSKYKFAYRKREFVMTREFYIIKYYIRR